MDHKKLFDLRRYTEEWSQDLAVLRQIRLLDESSFIRFATDRGLPVSGVIEGDPGDFHQRGWLVSDGTNYDERPLFHPFRIYPLHKILGMCKLGIATSSSLRHDATMRLVDFMLAQMPASIEQVEKTAPHWNETVDLAILLEPLYWPPISGLRLIGGGVSQEEHAATRSAYRQKTLNVLKELDPSYWQNIHESLRIAAAWMDDNPELYVLLRLSTWHQREKLKGHVSGALWIRHMAEVIRRGFEEAHATRWLEEDNAFGLWYVGARQRSYGAERPFDDVLVSKPYIAWNFGLFTGSAVRWYVEGDTEYYAVLDILCKAVGHPKRVGIEVYNLRSSIKSGHGSPFTLEDCLCADKASRRFSIVSFDTDVPANRKAIRRQVEQDNIVGMIGAHSPDFEFANFAIGELVEVAAGFAEAAGFPGESIRNAEWTGIDGIGKFVARYAKISKTKRSELKGKGWGRALAVFALEHPMRSDDGKERPLLQQAGAALRSHAATYDFQREQFTFDLDTFVQIPRKANRPDTQRLGLTSVSDGTP